MPNRVIREELLESERWADLDDNCDRCCYLALLLKADDCGNVEAGKARLGRLWSLYLSGAKPELVINHLEDVGLVRAYEVDEKQYLHVPRFRQFIRHVRRKNPASPWDDAVQIQAVAEKTQCERSADATRTRPEVKRSEVKGSEVKRSEVNRSEVILKNKTTSKTLPAGSSTATGAGALVWAAYSLAFAHRYGSPPPRNAMANSLALQLVRRLGEEDAVAVAEFFLGHNARWYLEKGHSLRCLVTDAEKLRTEWATGRKITRTQVRSIELVDGTRDAIAEVEARRAARAKAKEVK